ncbi:MAG TPA: oxidoreductase [Micromonosporaceae bacterium]|nr:oxidoreductase [Micromonosporaceae bacterium]HCU48710.1 oxidoreductase [Micromonosporaceae bacterium]
MSASVIVTGGTGGLGAAVTANLLAQGWQVVVPWVAESEVDRLPKAENLTLVQADLFDPAAVAKCVETAQSPLKAVVNLVGGFAMGGRVHETPIEDFEAQLRLNLRPGYLMCHAAMPRLIEAGGGAVVCVSSQAIRKPFSGAAGYLTAKTAVLGLVGALHAEYEKDGIRVNAILPNVIDTPANRAAQPKADYSTWTAPAVIAETIAFLCDDRSAAVRGSHLMV